MQRCVETKKYIRMEWDQVYSKFLKKVTIPASVETWGVGVFANNILEDITIED
ncbi:MAG: leucine-rich repeat domain-containing protein [Candidatus Peribacteria bacterium]|jgi:hypothetical protein|nr:leucine-rich repeat domain-containing protein [Candidatus Peribacteria bacterium]